MSENGAAPLRLPPGAADLISQLNTEEECTTILRAIIEKNFAEPRRGQNSKVNGNLGFPEELRDNQSQLAKFSIEAINDKDKIREGYQEEFHQLFRKRYEIVSAVTEDGVAEPYFWLSAMKADKDLRKRITEQDLDVLEYLRDVRFSKTLDPTNMEKWKCCKLEFIFDPSNPYFSNTVLTKVFEFSYKNGPHINKAEGTTIHWNEDVNQALGSPGKKRKWSTERFSFFNFFETKNAPKEEDGEDALKQYREKLELDYYFCGKKFIEEVIPHALTLCCYPGLKRRREDKQLKIHGSEAKKDG